MSHKILIHLPISILCLLVLLGLPADAHAGGYCGDLFIVAEGQTIDTVASICGVPASTILAANPGISSTIVPGQVLTIPNYYPVPTYTPYPSYPAYPSYPSYPSYPNNNYYYPYGNTCNCPPVSYSGTYWVQSGDTFAAIAGRYGVSVNSLWAANPQVRDINWIYAGQPIYVPAGVTPAYPNYYYGPGPLYVTYVTPTAEAVPLSYGDVPAGSPKGSITLVNKAKADVYVSLQGTTTDGTNVIREYPVGGKAKDNIPAAWYYYVAWVGGQKFEGQFHLGGGSDHTITFYSDKVVVE